MIVFYEVFSMFAFKVFVSTLVMIMILILLYSAYKADTPSGKTVIFIMLFIYALCIVGMWG